MNQKEWITIPILPCVSLDETISFWQLLGYKTTYYQNRPYQYGVVERGGYSLHFFRVKGINPTETRNNCLVMVTNAAQVYHEFAQSLRLHLGKIPNSGLPRISRMKPGQSRFTATDPSGNSVIFITLDEKDDEIYNEPDKSGLTALQKSVALAIRLRDFKNDNAAAVKVLDKALKHTGQEKKIDIAQALWIRAELANEMEESLHENDYYTELKKIFLTKEEIDSLRKKLNTIDEIGHFFAD